MKKHLIVALMAILGVLTGCGDASLPFLTSISVSPANPSVAAGKTQQFTAQGTFSNNSTRDLSALVTWSSSTAAVATIAQGGLATTHTTGTTTITATMATVIGPISGSTTLTVTPSVLTSIAIIDVSVVLPSPNSVGNAQIAKGTTYQFFAIGIYSDGGERNITTSVTWSSTPTSVATINNSGVAAGVKVGSATITATAPTTSLTGTTTLNVTNATLTGLIVSPSTPTIAPSTRQPFTALGTFSDGTTQDLTADVNWSSSNTAAATISSSAPNGVANGIAMGTTTITAAMGTVTGSTTLTVTPATLTGITLTPTSTAAAPIGMAVGTTLGLAAVGTFSDSTTRTLNGVSVWTVMPSNNSIATVSQAGVVTGISPGTATVTAKFGAISQSAFIKVENLSSIAITPASVSIAPGTETRLMAMGTLADGSTENISSVAVWTTSDPTLATISNLPNSAGWASGVSPGTLTIYADLNGQTASAQLTVTNATLMSIAFTPATAQNIALGKSQQYQATGAFSDSTTQNITNQVSWSSSDPNVAVINKFGLATATGVGTTTIKAVSNIHGNTVSEAQVLMVH